MMEMDLAVEQQQTMRISPRLVAANHILELSSMELQEALQQELEENPALEMTEYVNCPRCGASTGAGLILRWPIRGPGGPRPVPAPTGARPRGCGPC